MQLTFRSVPVEEEPARSLVQAMAAEIAALYDGLEIDGPDMPKAGPAELGPPGGDFLVGFDEEGRAVCCGGIKRLPDGACEIKRMYVRREARGRGVAMLTGRRVGGRCVKPTRSNSRAPKCTRYARKGRITINAPRGTTTLRFQGRIDRRVTLAPGAYRLTAAAVDAARNAARPRTQTFRILAGRRR